MNDTTNGEGHDSMPRSMKLENFDADNQGMTDGDGGNKDVASYAQDGRPAVDEAINLDAVLGISVTLSVELGRVKMTINELLHLTHGSVVNLNRLTGSPMDILANGTLIAHGEVVVVNDRFGIRLTDVVSAAERIAGLN